MAAEKNFENKIKKYLADNNIWFVKYFANRMTKAGIPDILACVNGYFLAIEVKAPNGHPSELQIHHRDEIRKALGISIILYPDKWEEFKQLIELLKTEQDVQAYKKQFDFDRKEG